MTSLPDRDADYFLELQTRTNWGRMLERFAAWLDPRPGCRALDVGTGPGLLPALLTRAGCRALGVDLDPQMFRDALHPDMVLADAAFLPFPATTFHLVTASNLLFLLPEPLPVLREMARLLVAEGEIAVLNPSERMSLAAAKALAEARGLSGLARETLLNYAARAERHFRWSEGDLRRLFASAGLRLTETVTRMGPGLVRFARGVRL